MKRIEAVLDEMSINYDIEKDHALIEFWTDTAGQDIPVEIDYDGTVEDLVEKFVEYANNYDVDDEVKVYVNMRGQNGVPNTVRELLDDCQEAKDTLMEIADELQNAIAKHKKKHISVTMKVTGLYSTTITVDENASLDEIKLEAQSDFLNTRFDLVDKEGEIRYLGELNTDKVLFYAGETIR